MELADTEMMLVNDPVAEALARVISHGRVSVPPNLRKVVVSPATRGSAGTSPKVESEGRSRGSKQSSDAADSALSPSVFREFSRNSRVYPTGPDGHRRTNIRRYESVSSIMSREVVRRGWSEKISHGWIKTNWPTVAGRYLGEHSTVVMIKGTTLFIECDSTAKATELRYLQTELLRKITAHVGPDIITQVKIFGPRPPSWRHGPLHVKGRGPRDTYG